MKRGWIGVDLDGTLAVYDGWIGFQHIGAPIPYMVCFVRSLLDQGKTVKIFTARADGPHEPIKAWCREHLGVELEITNVKDRWMELLYDDRAIAVQKNTGRMAGFHG